jgi:hypothetical protein
MQHSEDHGHEPRYIHYLQGALGYDLATCRGCELVSMVTLVGGERSASTEFQEWRERTQEEDRALPH